MAIAIVPIHFPVMFPVPHIVMIAITRRSTPKIILPVMATR